MEFSKSELLRDARLEYIDREKFGADLAITLPIRLKELGKDAYVKDIIPKILEEIKIGDVVKNKEASGIYVNLLLGDDFLLRSLDLINKSGEDYGKNDNKKGETVVVDYSSPNMAKHLHAGHVRSTIIGEVLSNIYSACGYNVYRTSFPNDWGGFGFLISAYEDLKDRRGEFETGNDFLYFLYLEYRRIEEGGGDNWGEFKARSEKHFKNLEAGEVEEKEIWEQMVAWSNEEFDQFYKRFDINFDSVRGESVFVKEGEDIVEKLLEGGKAQIRDRAAEIVFGDGENDYLVIRRGDESSIYATRDLAAIKYRIEEYNPTRMVYVVGQEQGDHFRRLFASAKKIGLDAERSVKFEHIYFGHYINAETKKKLSSREGAEGVERLVDEAEKYFESKYTEDNELVSEEKKESARLIAIGSIIFNDIKKGRKLPVEFDSNLTKTIKRFEESGGAYIMYTLARSRGIIRKYGKELSSKIKTRGMILESVEIALIKKLNEFPQAIKRAEDESEPSVVAEYLLTLAQAYNSYYENYKVIEDGELKHPERMTITIAVSIVLKNGLSVCHIKVPEKI